MTDSVYTIREIGCKLIKKLFDQYKNKDFEKKIYEKILEMKESKSYLIRSTILLFVKVKYAIYLDQFPIQEFYDGDNKANIDWVENYLFFIVLSYSKDKVANVRALAGAILKKMKNCLKNKENYEKCKAQIEELKRDKDMEVIISVE